MPRNNRTIAHTKVYHVISRGINKQDIFLDKHDFLKYKEEIRRTKDKYKYEIYSYALMNDHVHFIFYDENENISTSIQSLNVRYSSYFNKKYERTGHLFENRFKSRVIENEGYLKTLVRYIHKNPENAGLPPYIWTSYNEYLHKTDIINPEIVLKVFGNNKEEAQKNFEDFHKNYHKYQDFNRDFELKNKITDEEAIDTIKGMLKESNLLNIQKYDKIKKYETIKRILQIEGIGKEQISRIIGISRKTIHVIEKIIPKRDRLPKKKRP